MMFGVSHFFAQGPAGGDSVGVTGNPGWMDALPGDPWILVIVGVLLGLFGMPLSPYWVFLGFRLGGVHGFLVGWAAALVAMAIQFPLVRWAGKGLFFRLNRQSEGRGRRIWEKLSRFEANSVGLLWARLAWVIPFVVVNTWAAMGRLPYPLFLLISGVAIIPNIAGIVFAGDLVAGWGRGLGTDRLGVILIGSIGLLGFLVWVVRRWMRGPELDLETRVE